MEENRKFYEMMYDPSHHLVKMARVMDWDFISKQLAVFYPHRIDSPTKDPILLVKILLIQYDVDTKIVINTKKGRLKK